LASNQVLNTSLVATKFETRFGLFLDSSSIKRIRWTADLEIHTTRARRQFDAGTALSFRGIRGTQMSPESITTSRLQLAAFAKTTKRAWPLILREWPKGQARRELSREFVVARIVFPANLNGHGFRARAIGPRYPRTRWRAPE
jgi:hypothetical protein